MSLPCIVCDKPLEDAMPGVDNQPHAGNAFTSHGHYGSTVFDCEGGYLEINVCSECLIAKRNTSVFHVTESTPIVRQKYDYKFWNPPQELVDYITKEIK